MGQACCKKSAGKYEFAHFDGPAEPISSSNGAKERNGAGPVSQQPELVKQAPPTANANHVHTNNAFTPDSTAAPAKGKVGGGV